MPVQIGSFPTDTSIKNLTSDPDGCAVAFEPRAGFRVKFKDGYFILMTTNEINPAHSGKTFKIAFKLPGSVAQWNYVVDTVAKTVTARRPGIGVAFRLRVLKKHVLEMQVRFGQIPPSFSFQFPVVLSDGEARISSNGSLEFVYNSDPYFTLGPWEAKDDSGAPVGMNWRVTNGQVFVDLTQADFETAAYPVVAS